MEVNDLQIANEIMNYLEKEHQISKDSINMDLELSDLGLSSLDVVTLVVELEEKFDIQILSNDQRTIITLRDIVYLISDALILKDNREKEIIKAGELLFGNGEKDEN